MKIIKNCVPKECSKKQLCNWLINVQEKHRLFCINITVEELLEAARECGVIIGKATLCEFVVPKVINLEKKSKKQYTNITKSAIIEVYRDKNIADSAKALHISTATMCYYIKFYGLDKKDYSKEYLKKLYFEDGLSIKRIAKLIDRSINYVYLRLKDENLRKSWERV